MNDEDAGDNFLRRWSRRKHESARAAPPATAQPVPAADAAQPATDGLQHPVEPAPQSGAQGAAADEPRPLPDPSTLDGLRSEYGDFLKPDVDEGVRREALKKLFADPHFAGMDPIEFYSQDYTRPDPIPAAMLATLNQARGLLFPHEDDKLGDGDGRPASAEAAPVADAPDVPGAGQAQAVDPQPESAPDEGDARNSGASG